MEQVNITNRVPIIASAFTPDRPVRCENSPKHGSESQVGQPDKVTRHRKPVQQWFTDGGCAWAMIAPGFVATVDISDLSIVRDRVWRIMPREHNTYAASGRADLMHRLVCRVEGKGTRVDHRDHNGLNNRRSNLRVASQSHNRANSRKHKAATSAYRGVRLLPNGRWAASVAKTTNGVKTRYNLGCFATEAEATMAYNRKALELFGEFSFQNKIAFQAQEKAA